MIYRLRVKGIIPSSHVLLKTERRSSDEKTGTDFRIEASGLRRDKYDVPNPPSSAVRWAVIRMGIVRRPWKAHAKGVVTLRRDIRTDLQNQYSVTSLAYHLKKKKKKKPEGIVSQ